MSELLGKELSRESLESEDIELLKKLVLDRFQYFCQLFISPEWFDKRFHGRLCDFLQSEGSPDKLVVMPRTHLKTTIAATMYPLWMAVRAYVVEKRDVRCLIVSNTATNARMTIREIRGIVEKDRLFHAFFPEVIPRFTHVKWSDESACLKRRKVFPEATFEAAGVGTNIIRRHYNLIVEDDTLAPRKDAMTGEEVLPSLDDIEKAIGFHKLTIPLLITYDEDTRIYIGTRWAEMDVIEHIKQEELQKDGGRFEQLDVKAIGEDGKPSYKRFSEEALKGIRRELGPYLYSALYLNEPVPSEFRKFRREWIRYYQPGYDGPEGALISARRRYDKAMSEGKVVVTVDPADPPGKNRASQDYSAIVSCVQAPSGLFVLRFRRARVSEGELIRQALDIAELDNAEVVRVEVDRYAHLEAGFKTEMANRNKYFRVDAVKTRGRKKEARILRLAPLFENSVVFLRKGMAELENELYHFPRGDHDDIIDALAWQVLKDFQVPDFLPGEKEDREIVAEPPKWALEDLLRHGRRGRKVTAAQEAFPFRGIGSGVGRRL